MTEPDLVTLSQELYLLDLRSGIDLALALRKASRPRRQQSALKGAATKRTLAALARAS